MKKNVSRCIVELCPWSEKADPSLRPPAAGRSRITSFCAHLKRRTSETWERALGVSTATTAGRCWGTSGYGWHDADGVSVLCWRIFFCQITNILVVYVYIDEAAQLAFFGEQMFAQVAELRG